MNVYNKLEGLSLTCLSSLVQCLQVGPEPTLVKRLSVAPLKDRLQALPTNIRQGWKGMPGKKNSCLLRTLKNYWYKKFLKPGCSRLADWSLLKMLYLFELFWKWADGILEVRADGGGGGRRVEDAEAEDDKVNQGSSNHHPRLTVIKPFFQPSLKGANSRANIRRCRKNLVRDKHYSLLLQGPIS